MTDAATKFIGTATFQALTGRPVYTDAWDGRIDNGMPHIDLSRGADAILVAPATADFMAKVAHGLADDLLSTLVLARDCPLLVAPAMNRQMWSAAPTRRNVATLRADGIAVLGPGSGEQACGETGDGRMLEAQQLVEETIAFFAPKRLAGRRVLVTAGPTFEPIDPVRGITNLSSGKMGYAIARACRHAGADVVLVAGPTALETPRGVRRVEVRTARDMLEAVEAEVAGTDLFVAVAAVADWRVANASTRKLKKVDGGGAPVLEFAQNPDILATVAQRADAPVLRRLRGRIRGPGGQCAGQAPTQGRAAAGRQHRPRDLRPRRQRAASDRRRRHDPPAACEQDRARGDAGRRDRTPSAGRAPLMAARDPSRASPVAGLPSTPDLGGAPRDGDFARLLEAASSPAAHRMHVDASIAAVADAGRRGTAAPGRAPHGPPGMNRDHGPARTTAVGPHAPHDGRSRDAAVAGRGPRAREAPSRWSRRRCAIVWSRCCSASRRCGS
jgi:phosphopantothenoylcysteine decarboxylase/phosphopantothenate--cysteine ligase